METYEQQLERFHTDSNRELQTGLENGDIEWDRSFGVVLLSNYSEAFGSVESIVENSSKDEVFEEISIEEEEIPVENVNNNNNHNNNSEETFPAFDGVEIVAVKNNKRPPRKERKRKEYRKKEKARKNKKRTKLTHLANV